MMDGVLPSTSQISKEVLELSALVKNHKKSLVDRLESYEDIISIEIGDSPLTRMRSIERETGLRQLYIKFEGGNPSGTQKDRIAYAQCLDALRRKYDTITLAFLWQFWCSL
jgi:threonine synthase